MQKQVFKLISIMLISVWITSCSSGASNNTSTGSSASATGDPISLSWINKYPQLANMQQNVSANTNKILPAQKLLVGNITNQFGIRDDILKNILDTVPATNDDALYHAIKYVQYSQAMYLSNDKNEASQNMQDMIYAIFCLSNSYGMINTHNLVLKTVAIRGDSPLRLTQERKGEQLTTFKIFKLDNKAVNNDCHIGGKY